MLHIFNLSTRRQGPVNLCELQANMAYGVLGQLSLYIVRSCLNTKQTFLLLCSKSFNSLQDSVMIWPFLALQTQILPITFFLLQSNWLSYWSYNGSETSPHFVTLRCPLLETLLPQVSGWHFTQASSSFPPPSLILPLKPDPLPSHVLTLFRHWYPTVQCIAPQLLEPFFLFYFRVRALVPRLD